MGLDCGGCVGLCLMYNIEAQIKRAGLTSRAHARLMREINRRVMERQRDQRLPLHFENVAYSEYEARPRSQKYNAMKMRAKYIGHTRPNVKTGRLKRTVLKNARITATQYGAKLILKGSVRSRLPAWQKKEIAHINKKELRQERKRMASEYKHGATSSQYSRKRTRRIK